MQSPRPIFTRYSELLSFKNSGPGTHRQTESDAHGLKSANQFSFKCLEPYFQKLLFPSFFFQNAKISGWTSNENNNPVNVKKLLSTTCITESITELKVERSTRDEDGRQFPYHCNMRMFEPVE